MILTSHLISFIFTHLHRCSFVFSEHLYILDVYPPAAIFNLHNHPSAWPPRHSRLRQPAVGLEPQHYLTEEGVSLPQNHSDPLCPRCLASDTHGGCTRQTSARAGGSPGAAPALLLRGIPGDARTERKGRRCRCRRRAMLFQCMLLIDRICVYVCTGWSPPRIPTELSTSLLWGIGRGDTRDLSHSGSEIHYQSVFWRDCETITTWESRKPRLLSKRCMSFQSHHMDDLWLWSYNKSTHCISHTHTHTHTHMSAKQFDLPWFTADSEEYSSFHVIDLTAWTVQLQYV